MKTGSILEWLDTEGRWLILLLILVPVAYTVGMNTAAPTNDDTDLMASYPDLFANYSERDTFYVEMFNGLDIQTGDMRFMYAMYTPGETRYINCWVEGVEATHVEESIFMEMRCAEILESPRFVNASINKIKDQLSPGKNWTDSVDAPINDTRQWPNGCYSNDCLTNKSLGDAR